MSNWKCPKGFKEGVSGFYARIPGKRERTLYITDGHCDVPNQESRQFAVDIYDEPLNEIVQSIPHESFDAAVSAAEAWLQPSERLVEIIKAHEANSRRGKFNPELAAKATFAEGELMDRWPPSPLARGRGRGR